MKTYIRKLSPSRIESLNTCTWSYWCNYHLKLPDIPNDGSRRGSIIHDLYECLIKHSERHRWKYDAILKSGDAFSIPCIKRFIEVKARKINLDLDKWIVNKSKTAVILNRDFLNTMILVGLKTDFYGKETDEMKAEELYTIDVDRPEEGIRYVVRGLIDKMFIRRDENGKIIEVEIVDYKSSKYKFNDDKLKFNMQGVIYQLFMRDKYPEVEKLFMNFLFLQFERNPWQSVSALPASLIKGVEVYLTEIFNRVNNFTEADAKSSMGRFNGNEHLCGKSGYKSIIDKELGKKIETDEPNWECPYKRPFFYYAIVDKKGKHLRSVLSPTEAVLESGQSLQKKRYDGCPSFYANQQEVDAFLGQ